MNVAVAVERETPEAAIAEYLDDAVALLVIDSGSKQKTGVIHGVNIRDIVKKNCDALICGSIRSDSLFEQLTERGIVRFYAAGLSCEAAVDAMNRYELPLMTGKDKPSGARMSPAG